MGRSSPILHINIHQEQAWRAYLRTKAREMLCMLLIEPGLLAVYPHFGRKSDHPTISLLRDPQGLPDTLEIKKQFGPFLVAWGLGAEV